jgi:hypothetical protein
MKNVLLALARSLAITITVSIIVGLIALFFGHSPWLWGIVTLVSQFTVFYIFNTYLEYKAIRDARDIALREAQLIAQNTLKVECASCKKENEIIIRTDTENRFICGYCKTKNSVYLVADTAVVTEPLYETEPLPNTASTNGS